MRVCWLAWLVALVGCRVNSDALAPPEIDPAAAAKKAMAEYDTSGDGKLSADEVKHSALSHESWDADKDGGITEAEIQQRLAAYVATRVGLINLQCSVFLGQRPLEGAEVVFEPEPFLEGMIQPASGTTGPQGGAIVTVAEQFRPDPAINGVQVGLYRVRITHPQVQLPANYNSETELSYDVSPLENLVPPTFQLRTRGR